MNRTKNDPEETSCALCLYPQVARWGGSGNIVLSRRTQIPAPTTSGVQPPIMIPACPNSVTTSLPRSPFSVRTWVLTRSPPYSSPGPPILPVQKFPGPPLTLLISPASCAVSQAAVLLIWPQAHELPSVGSLADPALPSAPNSPSHFCRTRAREGEK